MFLLVCAPPPPHLRQSIALFAVAEVWLLLDIGWFVLFLRRNTWLFIECNISVCTIPSGFHTNDDSDDTPTISSSVYSSVEINMCLYHKRLEYILFISRKSELDILFIFLNIFNDEIYK